MGVERNMRTESEIVDVMAELAELRDKGLIAIDPLEDYVTALEWVLGEDIDLVGAADWYDGIPGKR